MTNKPVKTYTVIYRDGGTSNFKWHKVLETYATYEQAQIKSDEIEKAGYKTLIHDTQKLNNIGMPETY